MANKTSKTPFLVLIAIVLALALIGFLGSKMAINFKVPEGEELYSLIALPSMNSFLGLFLLGFSLFLCCYWLMTFLNSKLKLVERLGTKAVMLYLAFILCFPFSLLNLSSLLASLLCFISLGLLLNIYNQKSVLSLLFWSSFLLGVASILFYPAALFFILVFATMTIFRPFEIRNIFISIIGFLLPLFYLNSIFYLFEIPIEYVNIRDKGLKFIVFNDLSIYSTGRILLFTTVALLSISVILNRRKMVVRQQNQMLVLFLYLLFSFALKLFISLELLVLLILPPIAFFILLFYQKLARKWILNIYLLLVFLLCLLEQFRW